MSTNDGSVMSIGLGEPLMKADDVAAYLGLNRATIYRLAGAPNGIPVIEMKGSLRFRPADVRNFVEKSLVANQGGSRAERLIAATQVAESTAKYAATPKRSIRSCRRAS